MDKEKTKAGTGGSLQSEWTGTDYPVSEWASEIIGEALLESPIVEVVTKNNMIKRANKKTYFMLSSVTTATGLWATGATSVISASYETPLDYNSTSIDPVESRTYMPVAWEVFDEVDMVNVEADLRKQLAHHARRKLQLTAWGALEDAAIDSAYDWQAAGNALTYCDANSAIDWGDQLTVDNVISGFETIIGKGYIPTDMILPPALYADLFEESQFRNAAQFGSQNSAITDGVLPRFMGIDFHLDTHMPDDSNDKDVAVMGDFRYFMGMVVSKDGRIDYDNYYPTGEHHFYLTVKSGAKVFREDAAVAYYS